MSLITISSTNPNLSHILQKNPATISESKKPFERDVRKGRVYGWFSNKEATQFRLLFIDSAVDNSFGDQQFEFLDTERYDNPYAPIAIITAALNTAAAKPHEYDTPNFVTYVETCLKVPGRIIDRFAKAVPEGMAYTAFAAGHYKVKVKAKTVIEALNVIQTLCFVACLADHDTYVPLKEEAVTKYVKTLNRFNAPYYIRYLVASRAISSRQTFAKLEPLLSTETIKLQYGDTQIQRHDALASALTGGKCLIDLGCGEMFHTLRFTKTYESIVSIDSDEELIIQMTSKLRHRKLLEQVTPHTAYIDQNWVEENAGLFEDADVMLAEVLEHIHQPNSEDLLHAILKTSANKVVVTVPNKGFNVNYGMKSDEMRHMDHLWEPTYKEWTEFIGRAVKDTPWVAHIQNIGDEVDGESVSLMTTFEKVRKV